MHLFKAFVISLVLQFYVCSLAAQTNLIWYDRPVMLSAVGANWNRGVCSFQNGNVMQFLEVSGGQYVLGNGDTINSEFEKIVYDKEFNVLSVKPVNYSSTPWPTSGTKYAVGNRRDFMYVLTDQMSGAFSFDSINTVTYGGVHNSTILAYDSAGNFVNHFDLDSVQLTFYIGEDAAGDPIFYMHVANSMAYYLILYKDLSGIKYKSLYHSYANINGGTNYVQPNGIIPIDNNRYLFIGSIEGDIDIDPTAAVFTFGNPAPDIFGFYAVMDSVFHVLYAKKLLFPSDLYDVSYADGKMTLLGSYTVASTFPTNTGNIVFPDPPGAGFSPLKTFIVRTDTSLIADWAYYFADAQWTVGNLLRGSNRIYNNPGGIFFELDGNTPAYLTNSGLPPRSEKDVQILHCDTNGVITNFGTFKYPPNSGFSVPFPEVLLNDTTVFFYAQVLDTMNLSMNQAPVIIYPYWQTTQDAGSVYAAYSLRPEPTYKASGRVVADLNANFIVDSADVFMSNQQVFQASPYQATFSSGGGFYQLILDTGMHMLKSVNRMYFNSCQPPFHQVLLNDQLPEDTGNVFYFTPEALVCDLSIDVTGLPFYRQGQPYSLWLDLSNSGTISSEGALHVIFNGNEFDFDSASLAPTAIFSDSVLFSGFGLGPLSQTGLRLYFSAKSPFVLGDSGVFSVQFLPDSVCDFVLSNNMDSLVTYLNGSFDPNDKIADCQPVMNANYVDSAFTIPYTIRFQNTGNDTALKVILVDTLSPLLDVTSLSDFHASHPFELALVEGRILIVTFDPIALTDTATNYAESEGYFAFSIKPVLPAINGTAIVNRAAIYFDYNLPVITAPAIVAFASPVGLSEFSSSPSGSLIVFPNPAGDKVQVMSTDRHPFKTVQVIELSGREVQSNTGLSDFLITLDVSSFSPGVYLFRAITEDNRQLISRFIRR